MTTTSSVTAIASFRCHDIGVVGHLAAAPAATQVAEVDVTVVPSESSSVTVMARPAAAEGVETAAR